MKLQRSMARSLQILCPVPILTSWPALEARRGINVLCSSSGTSNKVSPGTDIVVSLYLNSI